MNKRLLNLFSLHWNIVTEKWNYFPIVESNVRLSQANVHGFGV